MKHLGDITKINGALIEPVDVIVGGSPCQDLSVAGKLRGPPYNDAATIMAQIAATDEIVGNAVLMLARGDELIGFKESAARHIIKEWSAVPEEDE